MKTIKVNQQYGNFDLQVEVDVEEKHEATLVQLGCLQILQRVPASTADKSLDGENWPKGKRGGKIKPSDWSRTKEIPFSEDAVAKLRSGAMGETMEIAEGVKVPFRVVGVTEHVGGETSPMVRATAFVDLMLGDKGTEANMRATFKALGMDESEEAERDALIEFAHSKGFGADPKKI